MNVHTHIMHSKKIKLSVLKPLQQHTREYTNDSFHPITHMLNYCIYTKQRFSCNVIVVTF